MTAENRMLSALAKIACFALIIFICAGLACWGLMKATGVL